MKNIQTETQTALQITPPEVKVSDLTHLFLGVCLVFCISFFVWAYFGKLDIVSMVSGRVVPISKVKEIQHLEGGIVSEILVREGSNVKVDEALIVLESTTSNASVKELQSRISSLEIDMARLQAIVNGDKDPDFSKVAGSEHAAIIAQARGLYALQMKSYMSDISGQKELVIQRRQDIVGVESRIRNNKKSLELLNKQIAISAELLKDNLTTEYKHLSFLREESAITSKLEEDDSILKSAQSQLEEAQEKLNRIKHSFKEDASVELNNASQELEEFTQRLKKYSDSFQRTTIRSPVKGVIKTLYANTIGGVITPGKVIMDIVPTEGLIVEAHLPIQDIGFVRVDQDVVVKLASNDARRYGEIEGRVINISPDATVTQEGQTYYPVRIRTEKSFFEWEGHHYDLIPGMMVIANIHTGRRTVLEYLLDPFIDSMGQAMQER